MVRLCRSGCLMASLLHLYIYAADNRYVCGSIILIYVILTGVGWCGMCARRCRRFNRVCVFNLINRNDHFDSAFSRAPYCLLRACIEKCMRPLCARNVPCVRCVCVCDTASFSDIGTSRWASGTHSCGRAIKHYICAQFTTRTLLRRTRCHEFQLVLCALAEAQDL